MEVVTLEFLFSSETSGMAKNPDPTEEEEDASISSDELPEFSHDQPTKSPRADGKATTTASSLEPGNGEDKSCDDDINLISDIEIRRAVEDFESTRWTTDQLEITSQTLLKECYASEDRRRRLLSAGMLRKLAEVDATALRYVVILVKAFPTKALTSNIHAYEHAPLFSHDITRY